MIDFISEPVITGFKSAVAIIVASGQAKNIFGLEIKPNLNGTNSKSILGTWMKVFENFDSVRITDNLSGLNGLDSLISSIFLFNLMVGSSLAPKSPISVPFFGMDHRKIQFFTDI